MSTLQVSNIHFESSGNNRLQYTGANAFNLVGGGSTVATVNTTAINFPLNLSVNTFTVNNSVTVGNVSVKVSINSTSFGGNVVSTNSISLGNSNNLIQPFFTSVIHTYNSKFLNIGGTGWSRASASEAAAVKISNTGVDFYTAPAGTADESLNATSYRRMFVDLNGNVGIGSNVTISTSAVSLVNATANASLSAGSLRIGNSSITTAPQILVQNSAGTTTVNSNFISTTSIAATSVAANLTGNVSSVTIAASANINLGATVVANASGVYATHLGGTAAAGYQTTAGLSTNVATLTANNTTFVGSVTAANVVSNAQLSANLANYTNTAGINTLLGNYTNTAGINTLLGNYTNTSTLNTTLDGYQTELGLASNVAILTANNANNLGAVAASSYARKDVSPTFTAQVNVSGTGAINLATSGDITCYRSGGTTGVIYFGSSGSRYLYYDGTNYILQTAGLSVGGDITAFASDERLKKDIVEIQNPLDKISQIRGVHYRHNAFAIEQGLPDEDFVGVIAQEIEKVLPEVVALAPFDSEHVDGKYISKSGENYKTVKYDKIVALLIEAIKELSVKVDSLTKEVEELKN